MSMPACGEIGAETARIGDGRVRTRRVGSPPGGGRNSHFPSPGGDMAADAAATLRHVANRGPVLGTGR
jgi:hypothetical protein